MHNELQDKFLIRSGAMKMEGERAVQIRSIWSASGVKAHLALDTFSPSLAAFVVLSMSTFAHSSAPRACGCSQVGFCCNLSLEWSSPPFLLSSTSRIKDLPPSLRVFG